MNEEYFNMKSKLNDEIEKEQFISTGEVTGHESQDLASMYYKAKDKKSLEELKEDIVQMNRYNITPETEQSYSRR